DSQIAEQQRILKELNDKKSQSQSKEMQDKLSKIEKQLTDLKNKPSYDAQGAIEAIAGQIVELRRQIEATTETQAKIAEILDKLEKRDKEEKAQAVAVADNAYNGTAATRKFLVNPGGQGSDVGFTQDAINSQGNSTMIFSYAPNQLYKIYCRKGYLTDLAFKKGESIQFVGGGDTAGWMVSDSTVDGVPHLYIKPVVDTGTTNLIVTTDKHSYQIILNTSDWYNPMVQWTYEVEDGETNLLRQKQNERITTGTTKAGHVEDLDFNFEISGGSNKPVMVFTDGEQTYIRFSKAVNKKSPLFVREAGKKQMSLVSYRIKDNYFIVEKVFDMAQIRLAENDVITIKHK
ncbi:MAG: TrbG/VirB9 family P-type conjugative transfer protein, partial [Selenomonadaceae bacterium]|nr:TrbG/VirB9 family P-type conjugative transfer protein [Selenomonadaceae bacterium]